MRRSRVHQIRNQQFLQMVQNCCDRLRILTIGVLLISNKVNKYPSTYIYINVINNKIKSSCLRFDKRAVSLPTNGIVYCLISNNICYDKMHLNISVINTIWLESFKKLKFAAGKAYTGIEHGRKNYSILFLQALIGTL